MRPCVAYVREAGGNFSSDNPLQPGHLLGKRGDVLQPGTGRAVVVADLSADQEPTSAR